jgi:hypothetical protein
MSVESFFARRPLDAPRPAPLLPRPLAVTRATWLFAIGAGLGIVEQFVRALLPVAPASTSVTVSGSSWTGAVGSVGGVLFSVAIQVLLIVFLLRAANWARALETVVTAVAVVYLPFGLILTTDLTLTPAVVVTWAFAPVLLVLQVIAIVLLYRPAANAFFTAGAGVAKATATDPPPVIGTVGGPPACGQPRPHRPVGSNFGGARTMQALTSGA